MLLGVTAIAGAGAAAGGTVGVTRVTVFGDSAATAMAYDPDAKKILGRGIDLQLEVAACRRVADASCPYDGVRPPNVVDRATQLGRELGPVVVVIVGYNDYESTYGENIDAALEVFRKAGVEHVLWATLRAQRQSYVNMNDTIVAAAKRNPLLTVVDWNAATKDHDDWLQPDGIHLTPEGARGMATVVNDALVEIGAATRPAPPAVSIPLTISSRSLPVGHHGRSYAIALRATGGKAPYRWVKAGGLLPKGLTLSRRGRLTGTPAGTGSFTLRARVVDRSGAARTRLFRLRVV